MTVTPASLSLHALGGGMRREFVRIHALDRSEAAHSAYDDPGKASVWYCSKFYRINLYNDHGQLRIRDLHIFREEDPDPFENKVCTGNEAVYETLPLVDGNIFSGNRVIAGVYPLDTQGHPLLAEKMHFTEPGGHTAQVDFGCLRFTLCESKIRIDADADFLLENRIGKTDRHFPTLVSCTKTELQLRYHGLVYGLRLTKGQLDGPNRLYSQNCAIEMELL